MIGRAVVAIAFTVLLGACNSDTTTDAPEDPRPEASATAEPRPVQGMRAIDRARDASELASERALRHDSIR